jgi:predicted DNA-binding antitoxin AbrB/MazE fold protein
MTQIEAIYQGGVFKPLENVDLPENERVRLNVQPIMVDQIDEWLQEVRAIQDGIIEKRGFFPDSTRDIAADRAR